MVKARDWQARCARADLFWAAWSAEAMRRADRLPDLRDTVEEILTGSPQARRVQSPEEMAQIVRMFAAATGGKVTKRKREVA